MIARRLFSTEFVRDDTRTIWIADGHRDDGKRSVVHADERFTHLWNWNRRFKAMVATTPQSESID
jgi:hypothetical protein